MVSKNIAWFGTVCFVILPLLAYAGVDVMRSPDTLISKKSLFATFESGGSIMWPILLCSMFGMAFAAERYYSLRMSVLLPQNLQQLYAEVMQRIARGERKPEVLRPLISDGKSEGAVPFTKYLSREFRDARTSEQVLQEYVEITKWHLQRNVKTLGLIANVSPLLGLFGTVIGMIGCFDAVAIKGLGKPEVLADGMAVALLTTAFGLMVAIPTTFVYHHLMEKSSKMTLVLYSKLHNLTIAWLNEGRQGIDIDP